MSATPAQLTHVRQLVRNLQGYYPDDAEPLAAVLADAEELARLRAADGETVERMARELFNAVIVADWRGGQAPDWDTVTEDVLDWWRRVARAALQALLEATPAPAVPPANTR